ncbi:MAG: putative transporter [Bacteroidales bacterium]|nr:putative transporter [Bacteroidales bacterium]
MSWLQNLLTDGTSIAHIVMLYCVVISLGVLLGKIKVGGVSLGVTFVLFVGILVGHFLQQGVLYHGFTPEPLNVLNFIQDFGLILFVYSIGLQVGPSFFTSLRGNGVKLNMAAAIIIALNIVVMLTLYYTCMDTSNPSSLPMMVGVLCGAVTNTPGLGAANAALDQVGTAHFGGEMPVIANGYACAYPLGVLGIIGSIILLRRLFKINIKNEEDGFNENSKSAAMKPHLLHLKVNNPSMEGKSILQVRNYLGRDFVCSRLLHDGHFVLPNKDTRLQMGDVLFVVCAEDDAEAVTAFIGQQVDAEWDKQDMPMVSKKLLVTKDKINGKTLAALHPSGMFGVNVTRLYRSGIELFASPNVTLQVGDRLMVVGPQDAVDRFEAKIGNNAQRLDRPNLLTIFFGILVGIIFGSMEFNVGMSMPVKLGLAGGPLIIAILVGRFGFKLKLVAYTTNSASMMIRDIGLVLFLASVGIKAGSNFVDTVMNGGLMFVLYGFLITTIPLLLVGIFTRLYYKQNFCLIMGLMAGATTDPPALAYSTMTANNDIPSVGYSTVYPLSMFLRIITAQILILLFCA